VTSTLTLHLVDSRRSFAEWKVGEITAAFDGSCYWTTLGL